MRLPQAVKAFVLLTGSAAFALASTISIPGGSSDFPIYEETSGIPIVRSLGQVFVLPTPMTSMLTSFGFALTTSDAGVDYRGYIYEWDIPTSRAVGSALYTSALHTTPELPTFSGLAVLLQPNTTYIAFVTTQGGPNDQFGSLNLVTNAANPYGLGAAYYQFSEQPFTNSLAGSWTTSWDRLIGDGDADFDLQFQATFNESSVPEPATFAVAGIALAALALRRARS